MEELLAEKINSLVLPLCQELGVELVDLNVRRFQGNVAIEILADKEFGGITISQCSHLNRKIIEVLEALNFEGGNYTVEVSSPGLDRPLTNTVDFKRARNREVQIYLTQPLAEKSEYAGTISEVEEEHVVISVEDQSIRIPFHIINKAKYIL